MPKTKISEYDATAANNTDVNSINIAEGCAPSGINNAIRQVMADLKDFQQGTKGDAFLGPVTPSTLTLTSLAANRILYTNGSKQVATSDNVQFDGTTVTINSLSATSLSTSGVATFAAGTAGAPGITFAGDTNTGIYSPAADTIAFTEGGVESMRIDSAGNVGIGTSSPAYKLDTVTQNATTTSYIASRNTSATGAFGAGFLIQAGANTNNFSAIAHNTTGDLTITNAAGGYQAFVIGAAERMRITSAGNVGIGTSSPAQKLMIYDASSTVGAQISCGSVNNYLQTSTTGGIIGTGSAHPLIFQTSATERMRINSNGGVVTQVGIEVNTLQNSTSALNVGAIIRFAGGGAQYGMQFIPTNNNTVAIYFTNAAGGGVGSIDTTATTTSYTSPSDYRLKENIVPMTGALDKVLQLKPITYNWKEDGSDGQGFIAHELAEVVPDAVTGTKDGMRTEKYEVSPAASATFDEEGNELTPAVEAVMGEREVPAYQGVDTSFLVATLTAAIQEQQAMIDELKAKVAALEAA